MNEYDFMKFSEMFDEDIKMSDFTIDELNQMLTEYESDKDKFKLKYFSYYNDVKCSTSKRQDW